MPDPQPLNLANCDKEPVHLIGAIQTHGYFFAFRLNDRTIYHASANVDQILKYSALELVGRFIHDVLPESFVQAVIESSQRLQPGDFANLTIREFQPGWDDAEVLLYEWYGLIAVEIEPMPDSSKIETLNASQAQKFSQAFVEDLQTSQSLDAAAKLVCRAVRGLTGFERVMMYRYLPNWDGEVIAEDKTPEAHTFLDHRFPSTDIPLPARELYLQNRTRQITDSAAAAVAILPSRHYLAQLPLDLSHSKLRAVSPVHLEYLRNMGVKASFSVAVIVNRKLWGLIACHGMETTVLPHAVRMSCEHIASTFAVVAKMIEELTEKTLTVKFEEEIRNIFKSLRADNPALKVLMQKHAELQSLFSATGMALVTTRHTEIVGLSPTQRQVSDLATQLRTLFKKESKTVLALENIIQLDDQWGALTEHVCGVLALFSYANEESVLMLFRPELLRTVVWGGDPRKNLEKRQYQGEMNPRQSFASWTETVTGQSAKWTRYQIQGAEFLRDFVFESLLRRDKIIQELGTQLQLIEPKQPIPNGQ